MKITIDTLNSYNARARLLPAYSILSGSGFGVGVVEGKAPKIKIILRPLKSADCQDLCLFRAVLFAPNQHTHFLYYIMKRHTMQVIFSQKYWWVL